MYLYWTVVLVMQTEHITPGKEPDGRGGGKFNSANEFMRPNFQSQVLDQRYEDMHTHTPETHKSRSQRKFAHLTLVD